MLSWGIFFLNLVSARSLLERRRLALREREGDIPMLVQYFAGKHAANFGKQIDRIPERMMTSLQRYPWPGNIRELEHVIERAVILSEGPELEPIDWLSPAGGRAPGSGKALTLEENGTAAHP